MAHFPHTRGDFGPNFVFFQVSNVYFSSCWLTEIWNWIPPKYKQLTPFNIAFVLGGGLRGGVWVLIPFQYLLWNELLVNVPLLVPPQRPHETPLNQSRMTDLIASSLLVTNDVVRMQWGGITSKCLFLCRMKQGVATVHIEAMSGRNQYKDVNAILTRYIIQ